MTFVFEPPYICRSKHKHNFTMKEEIKEKALSFIEELDGEAKAEITTLLNEIIPWIKDIHSKPPTTKNYYGDYMRIMSYHPQFAKAIGLVLLAGGANPDGVRSAYNIVSSF